MYSIQFQGHLLATSYWHVTDGADGNETKIMRAKIAYGADTPDGRPPEQGVGITASVPLVPSNSLRGRLHRESLAILAEALMARGEYITRETYQLLSNGGQIGGKESGELTVGEFLRARKNVHFGLWGGGPRLMPSAVVTCDLMPVCRETLQFGKVSQRFADFAPMVMVGEGANAVRQVAAAWQLVDKRMFKRNDDMMQLNAGAVQRLGVLGPNASDAIATYQAEQLAGRTVRRVAKDELKASGADQRTLSADEQSNLKKADLTNFLTMEAVIPGTVWPIDLRLDSQCTKAQVALFARSVLRFLNKDRLGSFGRLGFGQYKGWLEVQSDGERIGTIRWSDASAAHELVFADPSFEDSLAEELGKVSGAELNEFAKGTKATTAASAL